MADGGVTVWRIETPISGAGGVATMVRIRLDGVGTAVADGGVTACSRKMPAAPRAAAAGWNLRREGRSASGLNRGTGQMRSIYFFCNPAAAAKRSLEARSSTFLFKSEHSQHFGPPQ
jgi:hypothetical protein